jgi:iron complex outermembrane recepter protein
MQTSTIKKYFSVLTTSFVGLALTGTGLAQDTGERILEEIIVTAQYREQGLQDVPISVSAVTGETMTKTALQKAEDIQFLVPNFNVTETGISTSIFIRGIGSGINQGFEQSVGYYIDGVHYPRGQQSRMPFLDLARVEVLRGPQSILFGKNSVAGALNVTTARPTDELEGSIFASTETEDGETIIEGVLSGPFSDNVRARVAARTRDSDGYMTNATVSRDEPQREDWTVRGTLEFDIGDSLTATVKAEVSEFDVKGRHIEIINESPGPSGLTYAEILAFAFMQDSSVLNTVQDGLRSANDDFSFNELETYVLTLDWTMGDFDLKSVSAWESFEYDELCDCDFTGASVFGAALQESYDQFSQEIRLISPVNDNYDYILGLYYQTSDHEYRDQIIVPANSVLVPAINSLTMSTQGNLVAGTEANRIATVDNDVISIFAQFNWHISDVFTLQLGGRYTQDDRDGFRNMTILAQGGGPLPALQFAAPLIYGGLFGITSDNLSSPLLGAPGAGLQAALGTLPVSGTRDKSKFSPDVKLVWDVSDDVMLYGSWAQGFKSGSFDFRANNRNFYPDMATSFEFEDEEATNFEFGGKFGIGGIAEINATVFFTDYENLQISIFDGVLGFNVGNAAEAEIKGMEVDVRIAAGDYLTISGGLAYLDFEFTNFENGQCYFGATPDVDLDGDGTPELCSYTGQSNQMVSDWQGNVAFDFRFPIGSSLELSALLDVFYKGDHHTSNTFDPALIQDSYTKLNARLAIGAESGRWEIAVLGRNLTDEEVLQYGGDTPLSALIASAKSNYAFYSQGRTLSVQGTLRF